MVEVDVGRGWVLGERVRRISGRASLIFFGSM